MAVIAKNFLPGISPTRGFTLIELVVVIVVLGIMAAYAAFNASPAELSIPSQAQTMASNIRHLQAVANSGKRTRLTVTTASPGVYAGYVCNNSNDNCVSTTSVFSVPLDKNISLSGPSPLYFDTLGRPCSSVSDCTPIPYDYDYLVGGQKTVRVAMSTGFVTVSP